MTPAGTSTSLTSRINGMKTQCTPMSSARRPAKLARKKKRKQKKKMIMTNSTSTTTTIPAYEKFEGRRKRVLPTIFPPRHQAYSERLRSAQLKQTFTFELRFYLDIAQTQTLYRAPRLRQPKSFLRLLEGRTIRRRGLTTRPRPLFPLFCERRANHGSRTPSIDHRTATSQKAPETGTI